MALTRREFLGTALAAGAGLAVATPRAYATERSCVRQPASLGDIEHVVILIQENRSFDHYFGRYRGVRGFSDPHALPGVFAQKYPPHGVQLPFHLDTQHTRAECTNDVNHDWGPMHLGWNGGRNDRCVAARDGTDVEHGRLTMGYYDRSDLAYYYALADAFTICDGFFCSVLGPTDPNRLYTLSATLDPEGKHGGPLLESLGPPDRYLANGTLDWTTMPEQLDARGITWKHYNAPDITSSNNLTYFKKFQDPSTARYRKAFEPQFPATFVADCASGQLPQVSWVVTSLAQNEHPPNIIGMGEDATATLLRAVMGNAALWAKTVVFITWDENGGFFDHVAPPTAPRGTPGEWLTVGTLPSSADGIRGPIGMGFRVPTLVVSPFSRGGLVCSDIFDHTSLLRFLETRFGAEVPNLSAWRRAHTGDLTSAFDFGHAPDVSVPALPATSPIDPSVLQECALFSIESGAGIAPAYAIPANRMPVQEPGRAKRPTGRGCDDFVPPPPGSGGGQHGDDGGLAPTGGGLPVAAGLLAAAALVARRLGQQRPSD